MRRLTLVLLAATGVLAACKQGEGDRCQVQGDCEDGLVCNRSTNSCQEVAGGFDGQIAPDAAVDGGPPIDAAVDAVPSSVMVTTGECNPAVAPGRQVTVNSTPAFILQSGAGGENPDITLTLANNRLQFETDMLHNFENATGTPANFAFRSGDPGVHTVCLEFTAMGSVDYVSENGDVSLTGMITITP